MALEPFRTEYGREFSTPAMGRVQVVAAGQRCRILLISRRFSLSRQDDVDPQYISVVTGRFDAHERALVGTCCAAPERDNVPLDDVPFDVQLEIRKRLTVSLDERLELRERFLHIPRWVAVHSVVSGIPSISPMSPVARSPVEILTGVDFDVSRQNGVQGCPGKEHQSADVQPRQHQQNAASDAV